MAHVTDNPFDGFEDGTEVEVTIKGKYRKGYGYVGNFLNSWPETQYHYVGCLDVPVGLVQSVRRIEPAYEHGGVYRDAAGCTFRYWDYPGMDPYWVGIGNANTIPFNEPVRPLRKLVPES